MKNKLITLIIALFVLTSVQAQKNVIKLDFTGLFSGYIYGNYERAVSENSSVVVSGAYQNIKITAGKNFIDLDGLGAGTSYRYYITQNPAPRGWYASAGISYLLVNGKNQNAEKGTLQRLSFSGFTGYQFILGENSGFVIDANIGLQHVSLKKEGAVKPFLYLDGFLPRGSLSLGYAF